MKQCPYLFWLRFNARKFLEVLWLNGDKGKKPSFVAVAGAGASLRGQVLRRLGFLESFFGDGK